MARLWRREADRTLASSGVSQATALPLVVLARMGEHVRQGALADELGIEGPSLVRLIDQLEAEGIVERRECAGDRRAKLLHITPAGHKKVEEVEAVLNKVRVRLLGAVSEADLATTVRVLQVIEAEILAAETDRD
ncbi:MarR family winged helix-turn-helix transcriptional regulator [Segnochrobactrum spirostomi]|nr:MarR family transcriptional regulator [Segnochrobactrum spirostomi]